MRRIGEKEKHTSSNAFNDEVSFSSYIMALNCRFEIKKEDYRFRQLFTSFFFMQLYADANRTWDEKCVNVCKLSSRGNKTKMKIKF